MQNTWAFYLLLEKYEVSLKQVSKYINFSKKWDLSISKRTKF